MQENIQGFDLISDFSEKMYAWIVDPDSSPESKRFLLSKFIQDNKSLYSNDSGIAGAYLLNPQSPPSEYVEGQVFFFKASNDNDGPSTVNVSSLGVKNINHPDGTPLNNGDIKAGSLNLIAYNGTIFQLLTTTPVSIQNIQNSKFTYATDSSVTANIVVLNLENPITSYVSGQLFQFQTPNTNNGATSINIDGLGLVSINRRDGTALQAGDIPSGSINVISYDGTSFQLLFSSGGGGGGGGITEAEIQENDLLYDDLPLGTVDNIGVTLSPAPASYSEGLSFFIKAIGNNTTQIVIDVNGLGPLNVVLADQSPSVANNVIAGGIYRLFYDGTNLQLLNPEIQSSSLDVSFESISTNNVTLNPNQLIKNYLLNRSGDGDITFDATGVVNGNSGIIKIVKDATVTKRFLGFANSSLFRVSSDSYFESDDLAASAGVVTNAVNNGGLIRLTLAAHGYVTGQRVRISGIVGTTEANGKWTVTVIDANTFDLQDSLFVNTYTSGGSSIALKNYLLINQNISGIAVFSYFVHGGLIHINGSNEFDNV